MSCGKEARTRREEWWIMRRDINQDGLGQKQLDEDNHQ